ncbi:hypothetical protein [Streptomyces hyaluromycini]|uniref:hypothetical protein n=1 Tax=Streptomyces hyaluromycini TaxID=1377993 RepID=UPI0011AE4A7C|nr:hypothetical protein [Streptomyces hyaluromycini]
MSPQNRWRSGAVVTALLVAVSSAFATARALAAASPESRAVSASAMAPSSLPKPSSVATAPGRAGQQSDADACRGTAAVHQAVVEAVRRGDCARVPH